MKEKWPRSKAGFWESRERRSTRFYDVYVNAGVQLHAHRGTVLYVRLEYPLL